MLKKRTNQTNDSLYVIKNIKLLNKTNENKRAFGRLSKYADPSLIPLEEGAWERAVTEKYGKNSD